MAVEMVCRVYVQVSEVLYESYSKGERIAGLRGSQRCEGGEEDVLYHQVPGPDYQG